MRCCFSKSVARVASVICALTALCLSLATSSSAFAQANSPQASSPKTGSSQTGGQFRQPLARDIYKELVEIDTTTATGDTATAADAMAARLRAAGFPKEDVQVFKPAPRKGNLVARLRGTGARRPIILMAHTDVVGARREDWSTDPFKLVEKDGRFYARGASDDKFMAASFIANLIRFRQEGFRPDRDLVVVLETDEETLDRDKFGIQWLLKNQRALLDAEFALNEGGTIGGVQGRPVFHAVQVAEKIPAILVLEVKNVGGHASIPRKDNAIYRLSAALTKIAEYEFPARINEITRRTLDNAAMLYPPDFAKVIKAVAQGSNDKEFIDKLSSDPLLNALIRTTCVATILDGAGTFNALPQQVRATLNCRTLPGETTEEALAALKRVVADDQVSLTIEWAHIPSNPSPVNAEIMGALEKITADLWQPIPVIPVLVPGATDSSFLRNAGIPSYGVGPLLDLADVRDHGRDEWIYVESFDKGNEMFYRLIKQLSSPK